MPLQINNLIIVITIIDCITICNLIAKTIQLKHINSIWMWCENSGIVSYEIFQMHLYNDFIKALLRSQFNPSMRSSKIDPHYNCYYPCLFVCRFCQINLRLKLIERENFNNSKYEKSKTNIKWQRIATHAIKKRIVQWKTNKNSNKLK